MDRKKGETWEENHKACWKLEMCLQRQQQAFLLRMEAGNFQQPGSYGRDVVALWAKPQKPVLQGQKTKQS